MSKDKKECKCKCNSSKIPEISKYFIGGLVGVLIGSFAANLTVTNKVYMKDVNKDGIQDVVTVSRSGYEKVFYGTKDGKFVPEDKYKNPNKDHNEYKIK